MTESRLPEVVLFILDAGGGHRGAANALVPAAEREGRPWRFRVVSLQEVLAPLDFGRRLTGWPMEQTYNAMIRRRQTLLLVPLLRAFQWLIRRRSDPLCRLLAAYLGERPPALVVSLGRGSGASWGSGRRRSWSSCVSTPSASPTGWRNTLPPATCS